MINRIIRQLANNAGDLFPGHSFSAYFLFLPAKKKKQKRAPICPTAAKKYLSLIAVNSGGHLPPFLFFILPAI